MPNGYIWAVFLWHALLARKKRNDNCFNYNTNLFYLWIYQRCILSLS
jgi:hypothetical protein